MPIFEYKCKKCKSSFEFLVRGKEKPICPNCNSKQLEKQLSTFSAGASKRSSKRCPSNAQCASSHTSGGCCGGCCHHH